MILKPPIECFSRESSLEVPNPRKGIEMNRKKFIASFTAPIAVAGILLSLPAISASFADEPLPPVGVEGSTGSSVGTKPQCAWGLSGVSETIALAGAEGTKYDGTLYGLTGADTGISASVSGSDCSWYEYKKGARITVDSTASPKFSINDPADTSMDFALTTLAPLSIGINHSCGPDFVADEAAIIGGATTSAAPFSIAKSSTTTTSACTYEMALNVNVPANKSPKNAGTTYALVGPALTTTLTLQD